MKKFVFEGTSCVGKTTFINKRFPSSFILPEGIETDNMAKYLNTAFGSALWTLRKYNSFIKNTWYAADRGPWASSLFQLIHNFNDPELAVKISMTANTASKILKENNITLVMFTAKNIQKCLDRIMSRGRFDSEFATFDYIFNQNHVFSLFSRMLKERGCDVIEYECDLVDYDELNKILFM